MREGFFRRVAKWWAIWLLVSLADLALIAGGAWFYAFVWEPNRVVAERLHFERPSRTGHTGQVRLAQISDLDLTRPPGYRERKAKKIIARFQPDFIAFSGDIIGNVGRRERLPLLEEGLDYLASLPARDGTFIVLGEEERGLRADLERMLPPGVRLVEDELVTLKTGGLDVAVCGPGGHFPEIHPVVGDLGPALLVGAGASRRQLLFRGEGSDRWRDYEVSGRLRMERPGDAFGVVVYGGGSAEAPSGYELSRMQGESGFRLRAITGKLSGNRKGGTPPLRIAKWYRFRVRVESMKSATRLRSRVWPDGGVEPAQWQGDMTDTTPARSRGGSVGVVTGGWECGRKKYLSDLVVTSVAPEGPGGRERPAAGARPSPGAGVGRRVRREPGVTLLSERFDDPERFRRDWPGPWVPYAAQDLVVMIAHSPDIVEGLHYAEGIDLLLVGHTQGGQAVLPFFGPVESTLVRGRKIYTGTHEFGPITLHVNRGLGTAVLPARINCPPEVTLIDWRADPPAPGAGP